MTRLIVISAPSGAGKTTLCHRLLGDFPELILSISSTTRNLRGQERHGVEYFFITREEFERDIASDFFAEWALVHGNYYGTSKKVINQAFASGKSVLLDIDVQGAASLRKAYPKEAVLVFISPPSIDELERRLRGRGTDSDEVIQKRIKNARAEMERVSEFDHVVVNDSIDRAYAELKEIVNSHLRKERNG